MTELRLISFLPAATEMVFALGLGDRLVGVSHECDFPAPAKTKPVVVRPALPLEKMSLREIDTTVPKRIGSGQSLYQVDERLLEQLAPTHILTQALCQVCAPSGNEITRALAALPLKPKILWFTRTASRRFSAISANLARPPAVWPRPRNLTPPLTRACRM
jgi:iron complex transport system substrate-binding protein